MTNVVEFRPRPKPEPTQYEGMTAPDEWYFISDLDTAVKIAGYIYKDQEAVDLLIAEARRFYQEGASMDYLPEAVRKRCGRYLIKDEQYRRDVTESINYIYST